MSSELPSISAKQMIRVLEKEGFVRVRQKGSHIVLQKKFIGGSATIVVPNHKELTRGTRYSILRKSEISRERLIQLLTILFAVLKI